MAGDQSITLVFLTDRGTKERMHVDRCSVFDARRLAERVLRAGAGLYVQVEILVAGDVVETIEDGALSDVGNGE
jgi:hypothetical protein